MGRFEQIMIPCTTVGLIIGKQGSMIKHLQAQSGSFIQTQRDAEQPPGATEREVRRPPHPHHHCAVAWLSPVGTRRHTQTRPGLLVSAERLVRRPLETAVA